MTATEGTFPGSRRSVTVGVAIEVLTVDQGVWCETCLLSTAVTAWFTVTIGGRASLRSKTVCEECS